MSGGARQLDALTGIRGIAAWAVVLYHIRLSLSGLLPPSVIAGLGRGYLAVDLFFMLSGFVIWYTYADRLRHGAAGSARLFLWRRFARVWPLHALILLAFVGFVSLLALTGRPVPGYPPAELPLHILLVQNWGLTPALTWNHPAWSISTEFAAYLLFPVVALAAGRLKRLQPAALLIVAAMLMILLYLLFACSGYTRLGDSIPQLGLWRCLIGFTLGNLMCLLWQAWRGKPAAAPLAATAAGAMALVGWALGLAETVIVPPVLFAGLLALALGQGAVAALLGSRPLHYLGEISYSTYLAHFLLFILWKLAFVDVSLQLGWAGLGGFLVLVLTASVVLYHGVEQPAQRWLNAHPPRWIQPRQAVPAE